MESGQQVPAAEEQTEHDKDADQYHADPQDHAEGLGQWEHLHKPEHQSEDDAQDDDREQ
jgi:hypothetical protein